MQKLRILVAGEKALVVAGLSATLKGLGHEVVALAEDGRQAVASALRVQPDLIVMDAQLPLLDGIEATRTILAHTVIPVVLLTAYGSAGLIRRAEQAGVMAYLLKAAANTRLHLAIEVALARFQELQTLQQETGDLGEALAARRPVELARRVLMRRLWLSQAGAFRWMQQESWRRRTSLREVASTILRAEDLLVRLDVPRRLQTLLAAIRHRLGEPSLGRKIS